MTYAYVLGNGQRLLVQNDGDNTQVVLSSGDSGQQQNQSTGFNTGEWSKPPELFHSSEKLVLRIESKSGVEFIAVHGNQIESMRSEPNLKNAEKLTLKESDENIARMKPMEPMKPMKPMDEPLLPNTQFSIVTRTSSKARIPELIAAAGPEVTETYIDFFTATIRNRNTRQAYELGLLAVF